MPAHLLRIDCLAVKDSRERNETTLRVHQRFQHIETNPQIVGVEKLMFGHILERGLVSLRALGGLPQDQLSVGGTNGKVATFLVRLSAPATFHHEWNPLSSEVAEKICRNKINTDGNIQ